MSKIILENISELPKGWIWVKIQDVTDVIRGGSPRPKGDPRYFGGTIPWIMIRDISKEKGKFLTKTKDTVTEEGAKKSRLLKKGSLILSNSGTVCVPKILKVDGCIHDGFLTFPDIPKNMNIDYAYYWFEKIRAKIRQENQQGVTQVNLNIAIVKDIDVPIPSLNEQKRIIDKIEELFSLVDSIEQILIQTKKQLKFHYQSILKFYFDSDYEILQLNDVCDLLSGRAFKKSEYSTKGVRLFQIANVSFGKIIWNDIAYLPYEYLKKYPELELKEGDVIMALNRPIINRQIKVGMLNPCDVPSILYQRVGKFILNDNINSKFLFYFLQFSMFIKQLESSLQGIDIPFINKSKLMSFSIPVPSLKEQKIIIQKIEEEFLLVHNTENSINLLLLKIPLIKNTILKQAFEGKLIPQDPNDEHPEILLQKIKQEKEKYEAKIKQEKQQLIQKQKASRKKKNVK
ncbi:hypothetical protein C5F49_01955 [Nitrosopumilus oxyclinae]|uniref:Type I restriction modification DNA specificity domain-containing protein n=1 Tax=Nitrosopumilus oxyclinae TaxID=1959104 RepID=A0A7D5M4A2_9ARCH|nr:restriction endonuclease subunit S [Nitrosopumilus oxyclinae]QLH04210.1 hypothetical protein C5F49_01955 [Nitrosopumilus oxyclinae]